MKIRATALCAVLVFSAGLFAQSGALSEISGTVRDPSGAAVPGAQIKVTQTDTGLVRTAESGADGSYLLPSLPIGPYRLDVSKQGFNAYVQNGIVLRVGDNPALEVTLQVGAVNQQVVVEAAAALVETRNSGIGQVVDQQRVVDLPLNGRNPTQLIYLAGASALAPNADLISTKNYPNEQPIAIAGGLANGALYMLDGGNHNDPVNNLALPIPFPDALQEFKVETSALPAQYGQHSAGAINAVTKSGTNAWHGDLFEFLRNGDVNARNFFATSRDTLKRNQYGGTVGGPIKKDKLFFFLGYQGTNQRSDPTSAFAFIPTPAMLQGDFSALNTPACGNVALTGFANNQINPNLFNKASLKMMTFYNGLTTNPCGKTFFGIKQNFDEESGIARVDYQMSDKESLFIRYWATHAVVQTPFDGKNPLTETLSGANDLVNSVVIGHTYVLTPTTINSLHLTFNRSGVTKTQDPSFDASTLGINMTTLVPGHLVATASGSGIYSSTVFSYAATDPVTAYQMGDDFSMVRGNHQIVFGINWMHSYQYIFGPLNGDGNFTFNGSYTKSSLADFLLGDVSSFTQGGIQDARDRYTYFGAYVQDTWKLTPRLTLNYGLRWEPYFGSTMPNGRVGHFYPDLFASNTHSTLYPTGPAGYLFAGDSQFNTNSRPAYIDWKDFAPRFGLVWDPKGNGKMSVRASWGMFYDIPHTLFAYGFSQEPPWGTSVTRPGSAANPLSFSNPWAGTTNPFPLTLGANALFPQFATYTTYPLNLSVPYLEQWNLSIERQFGNSWVAKAAYIGNNTIHLWGDDPINAPAVTGVSSSIPVNNRRPLYLQNAAQGAFYGTIHSLDFGSTAGYDAMLLSMEHRLSNHFSVLANYTWSHCITDPFVSELDGTQWTDPASRRFDRGNCVGIDHRQIFNLSGIAEMPKFSNRVTNQILGNWKLGAIVGKQTGSFYSVTSGVDNAQLGFNGTERANQVLANPYCVVQTPTCWLNPAAFQVPANGTLGNVGAATVQGPGTFTLDMSLFRDFRLTERQDIEFRAEAFNLPNHFRPGNPPAGVSTTQISTAANASNFGQIQLAADPRILQFALKYHF